MPERTTSSNLTSILNKQFGINAFRPGQQEAIEHILAGEDTLVVMPTGYGKSLIYQLAALLVPHVTLVVSPLISLMKDQVDSLSKNKIPANFINSSLTSGDQNDRLYHLAQGRYKIVFIAPERLRSLAFRNAVADTEVSLLVVDEAHCLSQWGHDFRPDYLHIAEFSHLCNDPTILALTATATTRVQQEITKLLERQDMHQEITGFNRPNLVFKVEYLPDIAGKLSYLEQFLGNESGPGIIYTGTRHDAEEVAEFVSQVAGLSARCYHAGLDSHTRNQVQDLFMSGELDFVAATNAFGMGIDRPDVRFVIHYAMPGSLEAYYQEAGRAGRDGKPAQAILFYSPDDIALQEFFINNDSPSMDELRLVYNFVKNLPVKPGQSRAAKRRFRLDDLLIKTSLPEVKARVAIDQLAGAGGFTRLPNERGTFICVCVHDLLENEFPKIISTVEKRRQHKRAVLKNLVRYSETNECRREIILDYFGDQSNKDSPNCCDNCLSRIDAGRPDRRSVLSTEELIILDCASRMPWGIGKSKLALILTGSSAKSIARYRNNLYFGILDGNTIKETEIEIDSLRNREYFKSVGSRFPTLNLTPKGDICLKNHGSIDLEKALVNKKHARSRRGRKQLKTPKNARHKDRVAYIHSLGVAGSMQNLPEIIAALDDPNGNVRRLAASALGKMGACEAVEPLLALLQVESKPQVRQYSITALGKIGDGRAVAALEQIAGDRSEKEYNRTAAQTALHKIKRLETPHKVRSSYDTGTAQTHITPSPGENEESVHVFLTKPRPRPLKGPWLAGWALDYHSRFTGNKQIRSRVGTLVYEYKYKAKFHLAQDLVQLWIELLAQHPELPKSQAVIPVPSSKSRSFEPVRELAIQLAACLGIQALIDSLGKTRDTRQQKELNTFVAKQNNIAGAFVLRRDVRNMNLLLIDDLYDSGATLQEAARIINRGRPSSLVVLTLTKTIQSNW